MVISRVTLAKLFNLIHTEIPHLLNGGKIVLTSKAVGSITGDNECEVVIRCEYECELAPSSRSGERAAWICTQGGSASKNIKYAVRF